ncbi:hypothetical protein L7F22_007634 [Adiantum nelumboides]|nr:hypothetical protein [Adiantum nelumboides]
MARSMRKVVQEALKCNKELFHADVNSLNEDKMLQLVNAKKVLKEFESEQAAKARMQNPIREVGKSMARSMRKVVQEASKCNKELFHADVNSLNEDEMLQLVKPKKVLKEFESEQAGKASEQLNKETRCGEGGDPELHESAMAGGEAGVGVTCHCNNAIEQELAAYKEDEERKSSVARSQSSEHIKGQGQDKGKKRSRETIAKKFEELRRSKTVLPEEPKSKIGIVLPTPSQEGTSVSHTSSRKGALALLQNFRNSASSEDLESAKEKLKELITTLILKARLPSTPRLPTLETTGKEEVGTSLKEGKESTPPEPVQMRTWQNFHDSITNDITSLKIRRLGEPRRVVLFEWMPVIIGHGEETPPEAQGTEDPPPDHQHKHEDEDDEDEEEDEYDDEDEDEDGEDDDKGDEPGPGGDTTQGGVLGGHK